MSGYRRLWCESCDAFGHMAGTCPVEMEYWASAPDARPGLRDEVARATTMGEGRLRYLASLGRFGWPEDYDPTP